jgi:hypothetical protein
MEDVRCPELLVASYDTALMSVCRSLDTADRITAILSAWYSRECYVRLQ